VGTPLGHAVPGLAELPGSRFELAVVFGDWLEDTGESTFAGWHSGTVIRLERRP